MNIKALKERMEEYWANTTPEQLVKEFEAMGVEFINLDHIRTKKLYAWLPTKVKINRHKPETVYVWFSNYFQLEYFQSKDMGQNSKSIDWYWVPQSKFLSGGE